jgi:hypothetical protein
MSNRLTLAERRAKRKAQMQGNAGKYLKWVNDKESRVLQVIAPYEGFILPVKQIDGTIKAKNHYRVHILATNVPNDGDINLDINEIKALKDENAKIWTTTRTTADNIDSAIEEGNTLIQVTRKGQFKDQKTTYQITPLAMMNASILKKIAPKLKLEDIEKIESETNLESGITAEEYTTELNAQQQEAAEQNQGNEGEFLE